MISLKQQDIGIACRGSEKTVVGGDTVETKMPGLAELLVIHASWLMGLVVRVVIPCIILCCRGINFMGIGDDIRNCWPTESGKQLVS